MTKPKGQLTKRDIQLIEHCQQNLPISTDMAAILFYPNRYIAQRRLNVIHTLKHLKRSERLVVHQPYLYYEQKKDLQNLAFTKLLCDLRREDYEIHSYTCDGEQLTVITERDGQSYKINATHQNLPQVYHRLELNLALELKKA